MPVIENKLVIPPLDEICRRFHISRVRLFGSAVRGESMPDSDVDLLIDFETGFKLGGLEWLELYEGFSEAFGGRRVDALMVDHVHWYVRRRVVESAQTIYER